jgi:hypothetical protein
MPDSDEASLGFDDLGDDDESSLESSLASCPEEQQLNSNLEDSESSTVRERSSLGNLWSDSSVESPLLSDVGSQREITFEDSGFSLNSSSCEVNLPDFAMERRQQEELIKITEHSRETTDISLESEDSSGSEFGSSSDFNVLHLPPPSRTKNRHMVQGEDERSNNNLLGADAINFDKQFDVLHIACPIQYLRYDGFMNEVSHNSSEIQQDAGNGNSSITNHNIS